MRVSKGDVSVGLVDFGPSFFEENNPKLIVDRFTEDRSLAFGVDRNVIVDDDLLRLSGYVYD
jgi:hypothetical protein